jgi:hypothetical protein
VNVELARQQWDTGRRRLDAARSDGERHARLLRLVGTVEGELRRRVGQTFTIEQLAAAYAGADVWSLAVVDDARGQDEPPVEVSLVTDAAFHDYARRAQDYRA